MHNYKAHDHTALNTNEHKSTSSGAYPARRLRRLRAAGWIREMVQENHLSARDLIWPLFITEGSNNREEIPSMPGVFRSSIDLAIEDIKQAQDQNIPSIALFPVVPTEKKTIDGKEALNPGNLICRATTAIKAQCPNIGIITDVALDPYTTHGHDGILEDGEILNDATLEILTAQSLVQAQAGADVIAPSDMMDGRIAAIRSVLEDNNFTNTCIMSYAAKYASGFYGPFRDAVNSGGFLKGDKKTYQMNPANAQEALRETQHDIQEGADMILVKPGLPYLDIITRIKQTFGQPTFAYHVSGEYAMLRAAAEKGWLDYDTTMMETLMAFKRAGTDGILTYCALDAAKIINNT